MCGTYRLNGKILEQLPKKSVGGLLVDCLPTVHRLLTDSSPTDDQQSELTPVCERKLILKLGPFLP